MKTCIDCNRELALDKFPVTQKGNLRGCCKECFKKKKYMWNKRYIERIGGRTVGSREIIDKFKCNPVPILEREYWSFVK